jgi:hypothetical protein
MLEKIKPIGKQSTEDERLEEPYVRQVEDHSLPAQEVLADQQAGSGEYAASRPSAEAPVVFVP